MSKPTPEHSTRLLRKGALIEETYRAFACWKVDRSVPENLELIRAKNSIGARNESWLREVTATLSSRFSHGDSIASLVTLARGHYQIERWSYCLLWHFATTDGLYRRFAEEFLFEQHVQGMAAFDTTAVLPFIDRLHSDRVFDAPLTSYGRVRAARDLLRMAAAFGLVRGNPVRKFTNAPVPEDALLYGLYDLMGQVHSVSRTIKSPRWRLFLMSSTDVEHELFNLHQFRRVRYEQAGSVRELALPHNGLQEFAASLIA